MLTLMAQIPLLIQNTEGNTGTVTVTVDAVNDVTTVVDDSATTNEDAAINIDVIANDTDVDSKSPVATVTQGANGTVEINADGTVKYTPNANFNGTDTFTIQILKEIQEL